MVFVVLHFALYQIFSLSLSTIFLSSEPVSVDLQLSEFSLVSFCGSCEFYQKQEKVRRIMRSHLKEEGFDGQMKY